MNQYNTALVDQMTASGLPCTPEENLALYPKVLAGDAAARERMIVGNMSLVINKVEGFLKIAPQYSYLFDDMVSEGLIGLCTAVNKMADVQNPNPTGYISWWVNYHIGDAVDKESGVSGSKRTKDRLRAKGVELPALLNYEERSSDAPDESDEYVQKHDLSESVYDQLVQCEDIDAMDPDIMRNLHETIEHCCVTEEDRIIVDMRSKGYVDADIAKTLGLSVTGTYLMRREIYRRFLEETGYKGEV